MIGMIGNMKVMERGPSAASVQERRRRYAEY